MKKLSWISILIFFIACQGDRKDDCITSMGKKTVITRSVLSFNKLYVEDRIEVILKQDSSRHGEILLEGPSNLLNQVHSEVSNGQLRLINTNTCNFARSFNYDLKVYVFVDQLIDLQVESIAEVITADTLNVDFLSIKHTALSDIDLTLSGKEVFIRSRNSATTRLHGNLKVLKGSIEEISDLDAAELTCDEVYLDSHSPLDCTVNPSLGMYMKIYNSGNIYYIQEPTAYRILAHRSGTGNLLKR
ncbi:DUF2807 domain-containing protein [Bacteroidia bacterium]|nr:DUF2807 domain-containing protein [Bacteroidia bacterium]